MERWTWVFYNVFRVESGRNLAKTALRKPKVRKCRLEEDHCHSTLRLAKEGPKRRLDGIGKFKHIWRLFSSPFRVLPDFIIVGAQRCGTTSLYYYLTAHPNVYPASCKEIDYFNNNYRKELCWYRYHFPTVIRKYFVTKINKTRFLTGEASVDYMFHPYAPRRLSQILPNARLIVILRNPVDRAYSSYLHSVRLGVEDLTFKEAINSGERRLRQEEDKRKQDEYCFCPNHWYFSYLSRGRYVDQIKELMAYFSREQICIFKSEDFFKNPKSVVSRALQFLNLPKWEPRAFEKRQSAPYEDMDPAIRKQLRKYYEPYNKGLYELLGRDFGWEEESNELM